MSSLLTPAQFSALSAFLKEHSGYQLEAGKEYILESRLATILKNAACGTVDELLAAIHTAPEGPAASALMQAMTINETMFFRDKTPFSHITDYILPALAAGQAPRVVDFWCAACSSGQEPYSLAMALDMAKESYPGWRFHILATDLSAAMIARAQAGLYSDFEISRGLPLSLRERYFSREGEQWKIAAPLRDMISFKPMNLLRVPPAIGPFDVVFCRNVLIYFDVAQKKSILTSLRATMRQPGYLMAGAAEVLTDLSDGFGPHPEWKAVYITR